MTIIAVRTQVLNNHYCSQDPGLEHNIEFRTWVLKFIIAVRTQILTAIMTADLHMESSPNSTIWGSPHDKQIQKIQPQIVEFDEDLAEILKVKDSTSFSSLLLNEKKLYFEMMPGVFNLQ